MLSDSFDHIPPTSIIIGPDRQRSRDFKVDDLVASIRTVGKIINPIVIRRDYTLVAGERRTQAALTAGLALVPVRYVEDLSQAELDLIELEENVRRQDLSWQDRARALARMFTLFRSTNPAGTQEAFADSIGYARETIVRNLTAAKQLAAAIPAVAKAPTLAKATNFLSRQAARETANVLADVLDGVGMSGAPEPAGITPASDSILGESFLDWAPTYSGQKFNLLHCDFPYGVNLQDSEQMQALHPGRLPTYSDSEEVYWQLLECLAVNQHRLLSSSSHVVFWFSMKFYRPTVDFLLASIDGLILDDFPLIWMKTDNRGIAPDVERQPRRIYETALFGRIGDKRNVKLISNAYGAPKGDSTHPSVKPVPMLKHFLSMVVDNNTRLLDPTCGSGGALRAAESLGASSVLGLEIDPTFAESARRELERDRKLRLVEEK